LQGLIILDIINKKGEILSLPEIIEEALHLPPSQRYIIIENLIESLNKRDKEIDKIWLEESKARLQAYKEGKAKTLSYK